MPAFDIGHTAGVATAAMLGILSSHASDLAEYAKAEGLKIATSVAQIAQLRAAGTINDEEMRLHIDIQKNASRAVLMAVKGISIIAAEQAVNAALAVVGGAINTALGVNIFPGG